METRYTKEKVATFQQRFKELCDSSPTTDTALAEKLGVSKQTISSWKSGHRSPKKPMIVSIARFFHISVDWLMGFDVPKHAQKRWYVTDSIPKRIHVQSRPLVKTSLGKSIVKATVKSPEKPVLPEFTSAGFENAVVYGMGVADPLPVEAKDDKAVRMLKLVGKIAKEDPDSAVEMLKILVDKDLI